MGYEHDLFISYKRGGPAHMWVRDHFRPVLEWWLGESMDREPSIFYDERDVHEGQMWPTELRNALARTRLLVPVWTPRYFGSSWCRSEINTMIRRVHHLAAAGVSSDHLIRPVWFHGETLPDEVRGMQYLDMREWATTFGDFRNSQGFPRFEAEMTAFALRLAAVLAQSPPWDEGWPVCEEQELPLGTFAAMRL